MERSEQGERLTISTMRKVGMIARAQSATMAATYFMLELPGSLLAVSLNGKCAAELLSRRK